MTLESLVFVIFSTHEDQVGDKGRQFFELSPIESEIFLLKDMIKISGNKFQLHMSAGKLVKL